MFMPTRPPALPPLLNSHNISWLLNPESHLSLYAQCTHIDWFRFSWNLKSVLFFFCVCIFLVLFIEMMYAVKVWIWGIIHWWTERKWVNVVVALLLIQRRAICNKTTQNPVALPPMGNPDSSVYPVTNYKRLHTNVCLRVWRDANGNCYVVV